MAKLMTWEGHAGGIRLPTYCPPFLSPSHLFCSLAVFQNICIISLLFFSLLIYLSIFAASALSLHLSFLLSFHRPIFRPTPHLPHPSPFIALPIPSLPHSHSQPLSRPHHDSSQVHTLVHHYRGGSHTRCGKPLATYMYTHTYTVHA